MNAEFVTGAHTADSSRRGAVAQGKRRTWGLKVISYLFLAGVGSGACGLTLFLNLLNGGQYSELSRIGVWIGLVAVGGGSLLLLADLGVPYRCWRLVSNANSMMSVGVLILISFLLLAAIYVSSDMVFIPWHGNRTVNQVVEILGVVFAFATTAYTALLLGVVKARPFWNTPLVPLLWIVSSLSGGIAATSLGGLLILGNVGGAQIDVLQRLEAYLLVTEVIMIGFYLLVMHNSTKVAAESVRLLFKGKLGFVFWIGLVGFGLALPLTLSLTMANQVAMYVSAPLVLLGVFLLRYTFLLSGLRTLLPGESTEVREL